MVKPVLEIENIKKYYGSGHTLVKAVDGVTLKVYPGEIILIMGPSGSGKTTLITMAGGLLRPTEGLIRINEKEITKLKEYQLPALRLHYLGFIFQSFNLLTALNALENVMVPLIVSGTKKPEATKKATQLLTALGLTKRLHNLPKDLSGGEKQRVGIARALINSPSLIFADEPTANLDSKTGHEIMKLLCEKACQEGKAIVIVSHDQRIKDVVHKVYLLEDGKIVKEEIGGHNDWCEMPAGRQARPAICPPPVLGAEGQT